MIIFHIAVVAAAIAWVVWKLGFTPGGRKFFAWLYPDWWVFFKAVMVGIVAMIVWWSFLGLAWEAGEWKARTDRERREARATEATP